MMNMPSHLRSTHFIPLLTLVAFLLTTGSNCLPGPLSAASPLTGPHSLPSSSSDQELSNRTLISTNITLPLNSSFSTSSTNAFTFDTNIRNAYNVMLALHNDAQLVAIRATRANWIPTQCPPVSIPERLVSIELWYWIYSINKWVQYSDQSMFGRWEPPHFVGSSSVPMGKFTLDDLRFSTRDALKIAAAAGLSVARDGLKRIHIRSRENVPHLERSTPIWNIVIGHREIGIDGQTGEVEYNRFADAQVDDENQEVDTVGISGGSWSNSTAGATSLGPVY